MSEKAECPRCDSYVSEVYYDQRHRFCGWNCRVEWVVTAYGPNGDEAELRTTVKPTQETRRSVAALVGSDEMRIQTFVNHQEADEPLSPWLDPDRPSPAAISPAGKRRLKREEKRAQLMADAARRIDEELGDD